MNDSTSEILQTQDLGLNGTHEKRERDLALAKELLSRPVAGIIQAARSQFRVDFQELLAHRAEFPSDKWVAYNGPRRIGFGSSQPELVKTCLDQGLKRAEFLVLGIDPAVAEEIE